MSTKIIEGGLLAVEQSDVVMVTYNPIQTMEQPVIAYAKQKNKGIFIKKALCSGHLQQIKEQDPVQAAMQFIFLEPGVSSIIVGTLNEAHLKYNVQCAEQALRAQP
jgi:predicted aldo/keto reductase-like oxidoreductase